MSRVWFAQRLETAAAFWRVLRRDGVTLGFTTHDRDLWFDGVLHSATPGMVPSADPPISADFEPDSAEVVGALEPRYDLPQTILPQGVSTVRAC